MGCSQTNRSITTPIGPNVEPEQTEVAHSDLNPVSRPEARNPKEVRMIRRPWTVLVLAAGFLATATAASAQESAASFDALGERIQVGQLIWVTDTKGREVRGRLERLSRDGLVLRTDGLQMFAAPEIRRARDRDSLKNGTLVGLLIGGGMGTAWCIGAIADNSSDINAGVECAEGFTVFPGSAR
jgi:hypothetical protein